MTPREEHRQLSRTINLINSNASAIEEWSRLAQGMIDSVFGEGGDGGDGGNGEGDAPTPTPEPDPTPTPDPDPLPTGGGYDPSKPQHVSARNAQYAGQYHSKPIRVPSSLGPDVFVKFFLHTPSGASRLDSNEVLQTICVVYNGAPRSQGDAVLRDFHAFDHTRAEMEPEHAHHPLVIPPGGMRVLTSYAGGNAHDFARGLVAPGLPTPGPEFDALLLDHFEKQLARQPDCGPYVMGWPADTTGASQGGDGIEPYWSEWRNCIGGVGLAMLELTRTAQRTPRVVTDDDGEIRYDGDAQVKTAGFVMPESFRVADHAPLDGPTRHKIREAVPYTRTLFSYKPHDGQHFHRAYRAALWIDTLTGGKHAFARWYLEVLANFQAMAYLNGTTDKEGIDSSAYWSLGRTIRWVQEEAKGPNPKLGRSAVHETRFAVECAGRGIGGTRMDYVADGFVALFAASIAPLAETKGRAYEVAARKIPAIKKQLDKPSGDRAFGSEWESEDRCAQSRELQLAVPLYLKLCCSDIDPDLFELFGDAGRDLRDYLTPNPRTILNFSRYDAAGGTNPYYGIMTHGDLSEFGGSIDKLLAVAATRSPEAGGAQPLNSCPAHLWRAAMPDENAMGRETRGALRLIDDDALAPADDGIDDADARGATHTPDARDANPRRKVDPAPDSE